MAVNYIVTSVLRTVWNALSIAVDAIVGTVRSPLFDSLIYCHYPGCGIITRSLLLANVRTYAVLDLVYIMGARTFSCHTLHPPSVFNLMVTTDQQRAYHPFTERNTCSAHDPFSCMNTCKCSGCQRSTCVAISRSQRYPPYPGQRNTR